MTTSDAVEPPLCLAPRPLIAGSLPRLPSGTVDTHFHVFEADAPLAAERNYTPHMKTLDDWLAFAAAFGIERGVVVQPSAYGRDNTVLLAALARSPQRLRGVAVVEPDASDAKLREMSAAGVRGIRINTHNPGGLDLSAVKPLAGRLARFGWHIQLLVGWQSLGMVRPLIRNSPVPMVVDHFGLLPLGDRANLPRAWEDVLRLLDTGNCYVKLSAPYRLAAGQGRHGLADLVRLLIRGHADRLLWGSDWPHTGLFADMPAGDDLVREALAWLPDLETRLRVLVANPSRLYWNQ